MNYITSKYRNNFLRRAFLLILLSINFIFKSQAQSLKHPIIWITEDEKEEIYNKIGEYGWAQELLDQTYATVDKKVDLHKAAPSWWISKIPPLAKDDNIPELKVKTVHQHGAFTGQAAHAALIYYLTGKDEYAQYAADIIWHYGSELSTREGHNTSICGYPFYDARTSYGQIAIAYDFIYNWLKEPNRKVYSLSQKNYIDYDNAVMQKAVLNMTDNILQEYGRPDVHGKFISNHPVLTAPGALFLILCLENDKEREHLFDVFWEEGTYHQNSFKNTILPMFGEQGIWPESTSYSFMGNITMILNIIDRIKPEMNVYKDYKNILEGNFLFDNLRYPDRRFVSYGDTHRKNDGTEKLYRYTLNLAQRRGLKDFEHKAQVALKQRYDAQGGYKPKVSVNTFGNYGTFTNLLWGSNIPDVIEGEIDFQKPTVVIKHAGVVLQRNYVDKNNEEYGLCGVIGGAHYVHSHATGISMELYGAGYVMSPQAGLPTSVAQRRIPLHEHYFRLYAGNNTVVVNGSSHGLDEGSWKGRANVWQNTTVNVASEPLHLEKPIAQNFNFATQHLDDNVNNAVQERTLSTIRTSPTTGYYFDMFRSKSLGENKFHDYIYHNIGDKMTVLDEEGKKLKTKSTDKYQNDIGDQVQSPGWRYFEDTKSSTSTDQSISVRYDLNEDKKYMHQFLPSGIAREYTTALAPPSRDINEAYLDKKTKVLVVRQKGEAWDRPFISIYEPSASKTSSIRNVTPLKDGEAIIGAKVTSEVEGTHIVDYIICAESSDVHYTNSDLYLQFIGRFGIVRETTTTSGEQETALYIGEGQSLSFKGLKLNSGSQNKAFKIFNLTQ
ncbi:hypothetical protein KMW28_23715 [Flammeovirga yaeyamensis]|uniref:Heparinase II/III-like protein n=1 Tax=Flammeovirga yaeyamensis TaxID=367791 RepID=A0AAX1ND02_9BACT|nr:hypothetical protein [Flammeovirga yaeyamensis]MBB3696618.1 hypothetical protein [Flammeovirga yaeyamensis]NMF33292.1 hypothetical protein [Flammeovirga yaeyamensis]QWG05429.1 hypothetical protein KMW28_23715 [Flammeovirga yaeyamensis]